MPDLWLDDIQDAKTYPDAAILSDIRALIKAGQRESIVLDYKQDISDKDNWPEAAAAFMNSYGGLIIFGVEAKGDLPRLLTGYDPRGVETKTKLGSTLLSRIQPRPDFQIRVVSLDTDKTKEVALLKLPEGSNPPYMHVKGNERRVYVRVGAQKAEADYLQLTALFEKRKSVESEAEDLLTDLTVGSSPLMVHNPPESNLVSRHWQRFLVAPDSAQAGRRLTSEVEEEFTQCVNKVYPMNASRKVRTARVTCITEKTNRGEELFAVTSNGVVGFAAPAGMVSSDNPNTLLSLVSSDKPNTLLFLADRFCRDLISTLSVAMLFAEKSRYYGSFLIDASLKLLDGAQLLNSRIYFAPPVDSIPAGLVISRVRSTLFPPLAERWVGYVEAIFNDVARHAGSVLSPTLQTTLKSQIENAINVLPKS